MNELKCTPGKWEMFSLDDTCGVTSGYSDVAHCSGFDTRRDFEEEISNAHLIAAAKELYKELDALVDACEAFGITGGNLDNARAELAKAKGDKQC